MTLSPDRDDYISPHEAAERLYRLSGELENHGVSSECAETLRQISLRFSRHLNALEAFTDHLKDTMRRLQW